MANATTHSILAGVAIGGAVAIQDYRNGQLTAKPVAGAVLASLLTSLPDRLEPAIHPHHRQFFHSVVFAGMVGLSAYYIYQWQPEKEEQRLARFVLLVGCAAYLVHLAVDACSARSLPLIGKV